MSEKKVWFITGAGRGMGVEFAKAALAAGDAVVAGSSGGPVFGNVTRTGPSGFREDHQRIE